MNVDNKCENLEELESPITIEGNSLRIPNFQFKALSKVLWERSARFVPNSLPIDGTATLCFEILTARIMPFEGEDNIKRYVIYELNVRKDTKFDMDDLPAVIHRRYTDFRNLFQRLKRDHPKYMASMSFPNKVLVGNFSSVLIAERSAAFEMLLTHVVHNSVLMHTNAFLDFLQGNELARACKLLDERNNNCVSLLENIFLLLSKIFMDRSRPVLLVLCRLVVACTSAPVIHQTAQRWASLALNRYETLCDIDLLPLYIPLLNTCEHLWMQKGLDDKPIKDRLASMSKKGINVKNVPTLMQAIHALDPQSETV